MQKSTIPEQKKQGGEMSKYSKEKRNNMDFK
jgi:hypothetical protein